MHTLFEEYGRVAIIIMVLVALLYLARFLVNNDADNRYSDDGNHKGVSNHMNTYMKDNFDEETYDVDYAYDEMKKYAN